jgi:hypothetical protein
MGGASYGAICLLLLAFAPFELIVPLSTLTSLRPPTHPLDGDAAPPRRRRPPSPTMPPEDARRSLTKGTPLLMKTLPLDDNAHPYLTKTLPDEDAP